MGGSVNLQGGGQYQMPNQSTQGYGPRFGGYGGGYGSGYNTPSFGGGDYGDFGGQYPGVSTGGKGFQQPQYNYQPPPVLSPYVTTPQMSYDASTGGKGFQTRQAPSQAVAYAPMNIPRMSFAQPSFYYPSIANQMAGLGGLGGLGATQPLIPRPPMQMASYPALQPPTQPTTPSAPPIATGGKGFQSNMPGRGYRPNTPYNPGITAVAPPRNPVDNVFGPYTGSMREQVEDPGIDYPQEYSIDRVRRPEGYPQEQAAGMSESDSDFAARMAAMNASEASAAPAYMSQERAGSPMPDIMQNMEFGREQLD